MNVTFTHGAICRALFVIAFLVCPCHASNSIFETLVSKGIELSPHETIKLPSPVLGDGFDQPGQQQAIETILAGKYNWETFARKSLVAPFLLKINDEASESGKIGRRVDLYFVAFGSLSNIAGDNSLQDQLNLAASGDQGDEAGRVKVLSGDELSKRGLPSSQTSMDPRWVAVDSTLLSKVRISLTTQNLKTETNDSVLVASVADPRFVADAQYPNCWQSLSHDDAGKRQIGPSQPYTGLGSYAKITRLAQPAGSIFVEYHLAFAEPPGWFHGTNLLRSKLPILAQDMVRKFRRTTTEHQ